LSAASTRNLVLCDARGRDHGLDPRADVIHRVVRIQRRQVGDRAMPGPELQREVEGFDQER
jgi:hypothetical protein